VTEFHPLAVVHDGVIKVFLGAGSPDRTTSFDAVIDRTDLGDVVGIEVLDLRRQVGGSVRSVPSSGFPRWSYDDEIDALYIHLLDARAQVQVTASGMAALDGSDQIITLEVAATH
jgi:uncharacterized protein YuzE